MKISDIQGKHKVELLPGCICVSLMKLVPLHYCLSVCLLSVPVVNVYLTISLNYILSMLTCCSTAVILSKMLFDEINCTSMKMKLNLILI